MQHLFLHIGTPKTATTLFQSCCAGQADWLRRHGISYPETGRRQQADGGFGRAHHGLGEAVRGNRVNHAFEGRSIHCLCDDLLAETAGLPAVILSSEMLCNLAPEDVPRLQVLLDAFDRVTIIAYVRRQDAWAVSAYGSQIKWGLRGELPDFATFCADTDMDFGRRMALWDRHRGAAQLIVRPFVKPAWRGEDFLTDIFALIAPGLPVPSTEDADPNPTWPLPAIALIRHLNRLDLPERKALYRRIRSAAEGLPVPADEGLLTAEIQAALLQRYAASNRALAARFWSADEARLFDAQVVRTYPKPYAGPTPEQSARLIAAVWRRAAPGDGPRA